MIRSIVIASLALCALSATAQPATAPVTPEQVIVLDLDHPWVDASKWERNTPPNVYGIDMARQFPRINLSDANAKTMWVLKLSLPIDAKLYPLIKFKYRAQNTGAKTAYVLRVVHGTQEDRKTVKFFAASDLQADGAIHELVADLREKKVDGNVIEIGVGLWSDDKPAWIDVVGMSMWAAPEAPIAQKLVDDPEIKFQVSTLDGTPLAGAKVIVDAERANFARSAQTDEKGEVSIKPCATESHLHMARVTKPGYMTIDHAIEGNSAEFKTVLAVRYGGTARTEGGQVAADAQITVRARNQFLRDTGLMQYPVAVVTADDKGRWTTPPLPNDASLLTIQCKLAPAGGGDAVVSTLDTEQSQQPKEPWPIVASAIVTEVAPVVPATKPVDVVKALPTPPPVEPITAIIRKIDDTELTVGWTGIAGDSVVAIVALETGSKIPLMDITEIALKQGPVSSSTASFTLSKPATLPSTNPDSSPSTAPVAPPVSKLSNCRMILADNDRLSGDVMGWSDQRIVVRPAILRESTLDIPLKSLRELWCGSADQIKKAQAIKEKPGLDDIAFAMKDNDVIAVHGIVIGIEDDSLHFRYDNADRKIALNRLVGLIMAKPEDSPADDSLYESVQMVNDDQISGKLNAMDGKNLVMQMRIGASVRLPIDQIAKISPRNGRQVYLSDLKPARVEQTPFFDRVMEYRLDKSLTGKPITLSDGTYPRGVSMHARCILTYNLDAKFNELRTKVGFQLPEGKGGDCSIRILGDGKPLFEKPDARGDQPPADLKLSVAGVRELTLEVDFGRNDDVSDRVAFANARLLRAEKPQ